MNQNTSVDSDLQKAIDDITKSTNGDPLFADPVAAPAMPPMPTNVGPFPIATPAPIPVPGPMPNIPAPNLAPGPVTMSNPATINTPAPEMVAPEITAPETIPESVTAPELANPEPVTTPESIASTEPMSNSIEPEAKSESAKPEVAPFEREGNLEIKDIKEAALRELAPLLTKLDVPTEQKFKIYKNVIDNYHDTSVIASAYRAASEIEDDHARGEALLYIINSIDSLDQF